MGDESPSPNDILPATSIDSDFINELLLDGCWVETTDGNEFNSLLSPSTAAMPIANSLDNLPEFEPPDGCDYPIPYKDALEEGSVTLKAPRKRPLRYLQAEDPAITLSGETESYLVDISEPNKRIWIGPKTNPGTFPSVRERLVSAIKYLSESTRDSNILVQIWVPVKSGNKHVLTTNNQPFCLDPNSTSLAQYRNVSASYQFPAEENSRQSVGLPGRVFLAKVPEWTPDVRYFRLEEYPRIAYAQQLQVQGSFALPVFEQGSGTCLGVVEIVMKCQKINYRPELETVRKALEAFQLRSSEVTTGPQNSKILNDSYADASPQITEFLTYTCKAYNFPLAQTWAPCTQHCECISTVDASYYVGDSKFLGFHEECCEQHLLREQGIVGKAFSTNQLCFEPDITTYSKTDYPLSHHAILFGLCAAVAVRVRSFFTGSADFVLEFFLPVSCKSFEDQQQMIGCLLNTIRACQSLYVVTDMDLHEDSSALPEIVPESFNEIAASKFDLNLLTEASQEDPSWIGNMLGAQNKGKGVSVSLDGTMGTPDEEFKMTTSWEEAEDELHHELVLEDLGLLQRGTREAEDGGGVSSPFGVNSPSGSGKSGEKKRTKEEKSISLEILQQHFAGSLKDAAKNLGVCPTTLKRICRQHGISRWPSRKIKKVGHSLRKLQRVMDTVQGADGSIQISSFYSKFPELGSPNMSGASSSVPKLTDPRNPTGLLFDDLSDVAVNRKGSKDELLKRSSRHETNLLSQSESHKSLPEQRPPEKLPHLPKSTGRISRDNVAFRLKVSFGEIKVRFSLHHNWVFTNLQQEVAKRFNIDDINKFHVQYLDDDSEWVLLTCDADLEECLDIHRATQNHTIKLCVLHAPHTSLGTSFGSSGLS